MAKKRISVSQTIFLLIIFVISTTDIFIPAIIARQAGRDGWISVIIATIITIFSSFIWLSLASKFPNETLPEYLPKIFGQPIGKFLGILYTFFFIYNNALISREFGALMSVAFLPLTPIVVLIAAISIVSIYAAFEDIEVIARTNETLFPIGILLLLIVTLFTSRYMKFDNFLPVLENGIKPPSLGTLTVYSCMGECSIILYLYPFINNKDKAKRGMMITITLLGVSFLLGALVIAIFGAEFTADLMIPTLEMVQVIDLANFIQRLDAIIMSIWVGGIFIKLALYFYLAALTLKYVLNVKSYKAFLIPLAGITIPLSVLSFESVTEVVIFLEKILPFFFLTQEVLLPLIFLIVSVIKKPYKQRR